MVGIPLSSLTEALRKVPAHRGRRPALTTAEPEARLGHWLLEMRDRDESFSFSTQTHNLPLEAFKNFTFDELCKVRYSTKFTMDRSVDDLFEKEPQYEVVRKIMSSLEVEL